MQRDREIVMMYCSERDPWSTATGRHVLAAGTCPLQNAVEHTRRRMLVNGVLRHIEPLLTCQLSYRFCLCTYWYLCERVNDDLLLMEHRIRLISRFIVISFVCKRLWQW